MQAGKSRQSDQADMHTDSSNSLTDQTDRRRQPVRQADGEKQASRQTYIQSDRRIKRDRQTDSSREREREKMRQRVREVKRMGGWKGACLVRQQAMA